MATWQGVHPAMVIGSIQVIHRAIPEPEGLVFEEDRDTVAPSPREALHAGGMHLQGATPAIQPELRRPESILDHCPVPVLGEQAAGPSEDLEVPALGSGFPLGKPQHDWTVIGIAHTPQLSEPQRSAEPRRIWNRVYLGLALAQLGKTETRNTVTIQNSTSLYPNSPSPFPEPDRRPLAAWPIQRDATGLPMPHLVTLEVIRYVPPAAIQAPLQTGPRSKVGMPSMPQISIVSG